MPFCACTVLPYCIIPPVCHPKTRSNSKHDSPNTGPIAQSTDPEACCQESVALMFHGIAPATAPQMRKEYGFHATVVTVQITKTTTFCMVSACYKPMIKREMPI